MGKSDPERQSAGPPVAGGGRHRLVVMPEPLVLAAGLVVAGALLAFARIAAEVREGDLDRFDNRLIRLLRAGDGSGRAAGPGWLAGAMRDVSALGSAAVVVLLVAATTGYLLIRRRYLRAGEIVVATVGGACLAGALKLVFNRARPAAELRLTDAALPSFPSGHSTISAVVYLTLGAMIAGLTPTLPGRLYVLAAAMLLTGIVGFSRVYLGVHFPTDVLAGWTLGLAWALMCWIIARRIGRTGAGRRSEPATEIPG